MKLSLFPLVETLHHHRKFALNLDIRENRHVGSRMKLAEQLLGEIGAI